MASLRGAVSNRRAARVPLLTALVLMLVAAALLAGGGGGGGGSGGAQQPAAAAEGTAAAGKAAGSSGTSSSSEAKQQQKGEPDAAARWAGVPEVSLSQQVPSWAGCPQIPCNYGEMVDGPANTTVRGARNCCCCRWRCFRVLTVVVLLPVAAACPLSCPAAPSPRELALRILPVIRMRACRSPSTRSLERMSGCSGGCGGRQQRFLAVQGTQRVPWETALWVCLAPSLLRCLQQGLAHTPC
jgi:hypothetical protein